MLYILFVGTAAAQLVQQWQVLATTEGSSAQRFSESAVDADGNVYLLGSQDSPDSKSSMTLMKYDANGQKVWHKKLDHYDGSFYEFAISLKIGKHGHVYVLALFSRTTSGQGMLFYRVSPEGTTEWLRAYNYQPGSIDRAYDIVLSDEDDVYVAGFHSSMQGHDMFALKLNSAGDRIWEKRLDNIRGHSTYGPTLALDPAGDPYIAVRGRIFAEDAEAKPLLMKLDRATGQVMLTKKYADAGIVSSNVDPRRILFNPDGTVYMVSQGANSQVVVSKAHASGELVWAHAENAGEFWDVAVDAEENIIFSTWPYGSQLTKLSKDGQKQWARQYKEETGRSLAVDGAGNIAISGGMISADRSRRVMVLSQFNKEGELLSEEIFDSMEPSLREGERVIFDKQHNLYISGSGSSMGKDQVFTLKYGAAPSDCGTPVAVKLVLPPNGQQVGRPVSTTAMLQADNLPENITARWVWGDGTSSVAYHTAGEAHVTGQHTYSTPGVYTPELEFTDACQEAVARESKQPLAIFDPNAGFVTGGGWFIPTGLPDQVKVQFNFNIRYKQQGNDNPIPTGTTSFKLTNALRFESTSYDWLVVKDDKAVWQGAGQINGRGNFGFTVSVVDEGDGKKNADRLRLRIWDKHEGNRLYYDSHAKADFAYFHSDQDPAIGGGNIVIHSKDNLYAEKNKGLDAQDVLASELTAYPNPFVGTAMLRFELKEQGSYTVALYDLKGALVQELRQGSAQAEELVEIEVDASALPKGMYLARLVTDHGTRSVKMMVQK